MAIYHFHAQYISRGKGRSVVAAAAYRSGEKIQNQYDGIKHDYTNKTDIIYKQILKPDHAPEWTTNRSQLWNQVEKIEKAKNSSLAKEINLALPTELNTEQQIQLIIEYTQQNFVNRGMVADIAIHDKAEGNPHAHILLTTRPFNEQGQWGQKARRQFILDKQGEKIKLPSGEYKSKNKNLTDWHDKNTLQQWRENWATTTNKHLELAGSKERIDHRSYQEQGIEKIPTIHLGVSAHQMEQKGLKTDRGDINRQITKDNKQLQKLKELQKTEELAIKQEQKNTLQTEQKQYLTNKENNKQKSPLPTQTTEKQLEKDIIINSIKKLKQQDNQIIQQISQLQQLENNITNKYLEKAYNTYLNQKYSQQEQQLKQKIQKYQHNVEKYNNKTILSKITTDILNNTSSQLNKQYQQLIKDQENLKGIKQNEKQQLKNNPYSQQSKKIKQQSYILAQQDNQQNKQTLEKIAKRTDILLTQSKNIKEQVQNLQKQLPKQVKKEIKLEKTKQKDLGWSL